MKIPFISRMTSGCFPTATPLMEGSVTDNADLITFIVLYCFPSLNNVERKFRIDTKEGEVGDIPLSLEWATHCFQALEYCFSVLRRQLFSMNVLADSNNSLISVSSLVCQKAQPRPGDMNSHSVETSLSSSLSLSSCVVVIS